MLAAAVERAPAGEAVVDGDERVTWAELGRRARALAGGLARAGVGRGDRVATLLPNGLPFCLAVFATAELGAVMVPLNTKLRRGELAFMLENSGARLLLADPAFHSEVAGLGVDTVVVGDRRWTDLSAGPPPEAPASPGVEDDPAFIVYTSGTTGRPKGAVATHANVVHSCVTYQRVYGLRDGERTLVAVPLFHVTGLIAQLLTMTSVAGTCVLCRASTRRPRCGCSPPSGSPT